MARINILDKTIYNKIAAGEVVDRPSSIVKELFENSIDANASEVTIEIFEGGKKQIKISDNGIGILQDDVEKAFMPHATSKIKDENDLYEIESLGFRGEALSSIASVSRVVMITKSVDEEIATEINITDGKVEKFINTSRDNGTTIIVNNLFYNTPARLKFLKKDHVETMAISNVVASLILSHPNVKIKYYADGKLIYSHTGDGLKNAILQIYGFELVDNLLEINEVTSYGVKCYGFVSNKIYTKHNRNYQFFIVNGRVIKNQTIQSAVAQAYSEYLMKSVYPVVFLNIEVDRKSVDVNVHPQKQEVRFIDNQVIFKAVYKAIRSIIETENLKIATLNKSEETANFEFFEDKSNNIENLLKDLSNTINDVNHSQKNDNFNYNLNKHNQVQNVNFTDENTTTANIKFTFNSSVMDEKNNLKLTSSYEYIGQIFKTYLVIEYNEAIYLIDIHAAHERIIFDKLIEQVNKKQFHKQPLLIPYIYQVNNISDFETINSIIDLIKGIGIDIEEFSNDSYKISAVPLEIVDIDIKKFIDDLLSDSSKLINNKLGDVIWDNVATRACKAAVKANHKMLPNEINYLLSLIKENKPTQCPHGRPTIVKVEKKDIEKIFKRIV